jgi:hypothetical protein
MLRPLLAQSQRFATRILVPVDFRRLKGTGNHIEPAIAVDVKQEVPVTLDVAIPIVDIPERAGGPIATTEPVSSRDQIRDAVSIDVASSNAFIAINR